MTGSVRWKKKKDTWWPLPEQQVGGADSRPERCRVYVTEMRPRAKSLEQYFLEVTGGANGDSA